MKSLAELQRLNKYSKLRFKTINEMKEEYGFLWEENIVPLHPLDALTTMSYYAGKLFYMSLAGNFLFSRQGNTLFTYGPTCLKVHECMLTTRGLPKYEVYGKLLKVGHIVRVLSSIQAFNEVNKIPSALRNDVHTLVRITKINNPSTIFNANPGINMVYIDHNCVLTELLFSRSEETLESIKHYYAGFYKNGIVYAIQPCTSLRLATKEERLVYYKTHPSWQGHLNQ